MRSFTLRTSLSLLFTAFFAASTFYGQIPPPPPPPVENVDEVIKVESRLVIVPVSVTTATGDPVLGLTAESFRILEENRAQTIETVSTAAEVPLEIALLFDISATTSPMFRFQQETAAKFLQEVMRPADRAVVYTVGSAPILVRPRSTAAEAAHAVKSIVPTKQFTAFYDSVSSAAEYLMTNAPQGTRRVIVVISDGEDTNSIYVAKALQDGYAKAGEKINTLDTQGLRDLTVNMRNTASVRERVRVSRSLQNADTVFYSINPGGSSYQLNRISIFGQENMQKFADETGGTAFLPRFQPIDLKDDLQNSSNMRKNAAVLEQIFTQLANELRAQYLVQYYSESDFPDNKYVKLQVDLTNPGKLRVRARQGYYVKN